MPHIAIYDECLLEGTTLSLLVLESTDLVQWRNCEIHHFVVGIFVIAFSLEYSVISHMQAKSVICAVWPLRFCSALVLTDTKQVIIGGDAVGATKYRTILNIDFFEKRPDCRFFAAK